jgi:hypothetical protein
MLPPPPISPPGPPRQKPDYGMFIGIVGVLLAVLIPILQMNGVELNWECSAIAYAAIMVGSVWTFLNHAVPHCVKIIRFGGSLILLVALGTLSILATHQRYRIQHSPPPAAPTDTNVIAAVNGLANIFGTNQSIPTTDRLLILTNSHDREIQQQASIKTEISQMTRADLDLLRKERKNQRSIWANEQLVSDIISNQQAEQSKSEDQNKQSNEIEIERIMVNESVVNFDYVIKTFYSMLSEIAVQTGCKISADFNGSIPTIYSSNLIKDGRFTDNSNSISLGTNAAWNFKFTAEHMLHQTWGLRMDFQGGHFRLASVSPELFQNSYITNQNGQMYIELWIDKATKASFLERPYYTNYSEYTKLVDRGLRAIIESQDELSPLDVHNNY